MLERCWKGWGKDTHRCTNDVGHSDTGYWERFILRIYGPSSRIEALRALNRARFLVWFGLRTLRQQPHRTPQRQTSHCAPRSVEPLGSNSARDMYCGCSRTVNEEHTRQRVASTILTIGYHSAHLRVQRCRCTRIFVSKIKSRYLELHVRIQSQRVGEYKRDGWAGEAT